MCQFGGTIVPQFMTGKPTRIADFAVKMLLKRYPVHFS